MGVKNLGFFLFFLFFCFYFSTMLLRLLLISWDMSVSMKDWCIYLVASFFLCFTGSQTSHFRVNVFRGFSEK